MGESARHPITVWLTRLRAGEPGALDHLVPLVYQELRIVARRQLSRDTRAPTLSATTLVHEVYLRLLRQRTIDAPDRDSFFAVAAQTMRRILVDHARRRRRLKRGAGQGVVALEAENGYRFLADNEIDEVLAVDTALTRLAAQDERAARVVECRIFAGLTLDETAAVMGTSVKTVQRSWTTARAWLRKEMSNR